MSSGYLYRRSHCERDFLAISSLKRRRHTLTGEKKSSQFCRLFSPVGGSLPVEIEREIMLSLYDYNALIPKGDERKSS
jgi:hypothetical protein